MLTVIAISVDRLNYASWLFIVGLTLIFVVMKFLDVGPALPHDVYRTSLPTSHLPSSAG